MKTEFVEVSNLKVGDKVKFHPDSNTRAWWTVKARNAEHVVAVRQAPFEAKGEMEYTVTGWLNRPYNLQGPGVVRSSLNTLGGGRDVGKNGEAAQTVIEGIEEDHWELSMRRVISVNLIEVKRD